MAYDFKDFKQKTEEVNDWLRKNLASIRTGRATVTLLDSVMVESYGVKTPLNQTSNITIEDPKTIRIVPWDKGLIPALEKGITLADLGVSTSVDSEGVRVKFPDLTTETRERLAKQAKSKVEEAKVSLRNERNKVMKEIDEEKRGGNLSEDDAKRSEEELNKIIKEKNDDFDELGKNKEKEILS